MKFYFFLLRCLSARRAKHWDLRKNVINVGREINTLDVTKKICVDVWRKWSLKRVHCRLSGGMQSSLVMDAAIVWWIMQHATPTWTRSIDTQCRAWVIVVCSAREFSANAREPRQFIQSVRKKLKITQSPDLDLKLKVSKSALMNVTWICFLIETYRRVTVVSLVD